MFGPAIFNTDVVVQPVLSTAGAYASGQALGPSFPIAGVARGPNAWSVLSKISVVDSDRQNAALILYLFKAPLVVDGVARTTFDVTAPDAVNFMGAIPIAAGTVLTSFSVKDLVLNPPEPISPSLQPATIYGVLVTTGTPTYTTTSSVKATLTFTHN